MAIRVLETCDGCGATKERASHDFATIQSIRASFSWGGLCMVTETERDSRMLCKPCALKIANAVRAALAAKPAPKHPPKTERTDAAIELYEQARGLWMLCAMADVGDAVYREKVADKGSAPTLLDLVEACAQRAGFSSDTDLEQAHALGYGGWFEFKRQHGQDTGDAEEEIVGSLEDFQAALEGEIGEQYARVGGAFQDIRNGWVRWLR